MVHWSDSLIGSTGSLILGLLNNSLIGSSDSLIGSYHSPIGSYHSLI